MGTERRWICSGEQWHSRVGSPKNPQGHGFIAAASMNRAGKVTQMAARAMVTQPSSSGWGITSSTLRWNSGSSSRNSTPWCPSDTSPGRRRQLFSPPSADVSGTMRAVQTTNPCVIGHRIIGSLMQFFFQVPETHTKET